MIAYLFQRKAFRHQMAGTGMAQAMRSAARHLDSECTQTCANQAVRGALREPPNRRLAGKKHSPLYAAGPYLWELPQNGIADRAYQRVLLCPPLLGTRDRNDLSFPVQVFQA